MSSEFRVPGSESPSLVRKGGLGRVGLLSCLALLLMAGGAAQATLTTGLDVATVNSTGSTAAAVNLNNVAGAIDATVGALSNATGATPVIDIDATSANVALGTSVTNTTGVSVEVTNSGSTAAGGNTITLTGAIADSGGGVRLDNNDQNTNGATVRFGGTLTLNTGASTAFNAVNGGRVEATGSGSVITTTTGTGVNIANTTIGASGVTFQSVSVNGAPNGIVLDTTGATGFFTVSGDGSMTGGVFDRDGSGGTITNTSNDAVALSSAHNVTLRQVDVSNCGNSSAGDDCIDSVGGSNHVLSAVSVSNATGTGVNEEFGNGWRLTDIAGNNRIDHDSLFTNFPVASTHAVRLRNTDTNGNLTISDSGFTAQGTLNSATYVTVQSFGNSDIDFTVTADSQFTGLRGDAILSAAGEAPGSTGTVTTLIENSDFLSAAANGSGAIAMTVSQSGATQNFTVQNNVFRDLSTTLAAPVGIVTANAANGGGTLSGSILNNTIDPNSGTRRGIQIVGQTTSAAAIVGSVNVTIDNNDIDRIPTSFAILTDVDDGIGDSTINITNNRIGLRAGSEGAIGDEFDGALLMRVRGTPAATVNTTVSGNTIRASVPMGGRIMYIDARDSRTANFDILNNVIRNDGVGAPDPEFFDRVLGAANVVCMNLKGNNAIDSTGAAGSGDFDLNEGSGTVTVEGLATVAADNQGTFAIEAGIGNATNCIP